MKWIWRTAIVFFLIAIGKGLTFRLSVWKPLRLSSLSSSINDLQEKKAITLTPKAKDHLLKLKSEGLHLRMGVKSGGCSGLSYVMNIINSTATSEDDYVQEIDGIKCVIDPKSLLYLFGLELDFSDELIGGGFQFKNPNAGSSW
jgi:iron-sulfur cluster assembly accessory protein